MATRVQGGTTQKAFGRFDAGYAHCHYEVRKAPTGPSDTNTVNPEQWHAGRRGGALTIVLLLGGLVALGAIVARSRVGDRL